MKVVLIGYGSIGKRHVNNLLLLGIKDITLCRVIAKGNDLNLKEIEDINEVVKLEPDFIIVSNPTFMHYQSLKILLINQINILCEKPLIHTFEEWTLLKPLLEDYEGVASIVFNLRYHPCIQKVKELLEDNELGEVNFGRFFVGQYLPDWRLKINHLDSYSASKKKGGGVVMDLIHEIDIAEYLLSKPKGQINSIVSKVSDVTVDSVDIAEVIYKTINNKVVNIHLDYLYRGFSRHFLIVGKKANLHCDLFKNIIKITGNHNQLLKSFKYNDFKRNNMYIDLLKDYMESLINTDYHSRLPSFYENESVMNTSFQINN